MRALHSEGACVRERLVSELMTDEVVTCSPGEQVDYMMAVMTQKRFRHAPVVESGKLAGIISIGDVVATRVAELERCLLYTSPSPRDRQKSRMPSSA